MTEPKRTPYFGSLDGLRGLAVLAVLWHHAGERGLGPAIAQRGFLGVDLFFVISGFLITTLLLREVRAAGRIHLGAFYARRALRLMPLYYALLGVLALLFGAVWPDALMSGPFFDDLPWYASYSSNWIVPGTFMAITWSLAMEEQFYLTWPTILRWAPGSASSCLLLAGGSSLLVHSGLLDELLQSVFGPAWQLLPMLGSTLLPLALGCAMALSLERGKARWIAWAKNSWAAPLSLALLLATCALPFAWPSGPLIAGAQLCMAALVASCVVREDNGLKRLLHLAPLRRVGTVSYGVYLLHMLCLQGIYELEARGFISGPFARFAATAVVTYACAELSYRFLESPFLRLRNRFRAPVLPSAQ